MAKIILLLITLLSLSLCSFNVTRAKIHAKLAVVTHCSQQQIEEWSCRPCKQYPNLIDVKQIYNTLTKIKGFIGYDKISNSITVAWRCTQEVSNYLEDINIRLTDYSGCSKCKVHQGFYFSYLSVKNQVFDKVKQLLVKYPQAQIVVIGHSLGAAIATITVLELHEQYPSKVSQMYNYGSPRVGNGYFARNLASKINVFRVVHNRDTFVHLPPQDFQYLHAPFEILFDEEMQKYQICNDSGEDEECSNRFFPKYSSADHWYYFGDIDESVC